MFRTASAALILMVFMLGVTPKLFIHELFATHTDAPSMKDHAEHAHFNKGGFVCDCNDLVTTSPFTPQAEVEELILTTTWKTFVGRSYSPKLSSQHFFFDLRGPPAVV